MATLMSAGTRTKSFSLKSVGIQASGRTTILKINYRNTRQILQLAHRMAGDMLLQPEDAEGGDDGIPLLQPLSCGRKGPEPIVIDDLPTLPERAARMAELLADRYAQGHPLGRHGRAVPASQRDGGVCCRPGAQGAAAPGTQAAR